MLSAVTITRLEKAAADNGFDLEREHTANWLSFGSSQTSMSIWITTTGDSRFLAAASRSDVLDGSLKVHGLHRAHERYLPWHRSKIFRHNWRVHRP